MNLTLATNHQLLEELMQRFKRNGWVDFYSDILHVLQRLTDDELARYGLIDWPNAFKQRLLDHQHHGGWVESVDGLTCADDQELVSPSPEWLRRHDLGAQFADRPGS